jgi:tetratricopeptide (TPR) repeat protein
MDVSKPYLDKAFELKDRASEPERLYITAHYYADNGQLEKGTAAYELYKQTYPREVTPHVNLGVTYYELGEFEKAIANGQEAVRVEPDEVRGYVVEAQGYLGLNRPEEAKAVLRAALQRNAAFIGPHSVLAGIAYAQGDPAAMAKEEEFLHGHPWEEELLALLHGNIAASRGQMAKAKEFYDQIRQNGERMQLKDWQALGSADPGYILALFGEGKKALEPANAALAMAPSYNVEMYVAHILALAGENAKALDVANKAAAKRPDDTIVHEAEVPDVQAIVALNTGDAKKAIEILKSALPYDKTRTGTIYLRGLAYLKAGQASDAAGEFQRVLGLNYYAPGDVLMPFARLGLARAYVLEGDSAKAKSTYQDLLAFWKDADPDLPVVKQAKAEYAKL